MIPCLCEQLTSVFRGSSANEFLCKALESKTNQCLQAIQMANFGVYILILVSLMNEERCLAATNFCQQPLGMERRIITDSQISASSTYRADLYSGYEARLNNNRCWCSATSSQTNQYVKVDFGRLLSVTGIAIQGDPAHPPNYITKFKLTFTTDGTKYLYKIDSTNVQKEFVGANGQNQLIQRWFLTKPFPAKIMEFKPTEKAASGNDICARFELYGCAYVCGGGLGIESGLSLPSGFTLSASSSKAGFEASNGRLSGSPSWCASTNNVNSEYLQIDFGRIITMTGIAIQGNPNADSWVKEFYLDYGTSSSSLVTYQEGGVSKVFVGNNDRSTIVVNWFLVRFTTRYVRVKPKTVNGDICIRIEITGCDSEFVGEIGAENRVLEDSRFHAFAWSDFLSNGRYQAKDGRLNNDRPWGRTKTDTSFMWFKIDLGRVFLVNGIATQGDGTYGPNFFPDYKLDFSLKSPGSTVVYVKEEISSAVKIFPGNTNNQGVKFHFLSKNPISARYIRFLKHTQPAHDYNLRVEIYGRPQACWKSFGMVDGENPSFVSIVTVSSGTVTHLPKLNSAFTWCAGTHDSNQHIQFDLGSVKIVSGIAIQGTRGLSDWVKSFKIKYGETSASNTFMDGSSEKVFVGSNTNELIVHNWFSSDIKARYVQILPQTWHSYICLRANLYGCPESGCFERIGIESTSQVANSLITSSTFASGKEAYKGRLNMAYDTWAACQVGSCSPKESGSAKPWIQVCLGSAHTFSAIIIQGYGNADDVALVNEFSVRYGYTSTFYDYHYGGALKKFAGATGRYASKQINLPVKVAAKCLRLQVEAKTPSTKDAGLRWELLGCNSVSKVAIVLSQASAIVSRGNQISLTCSVKNQIGFSLSWSSSGTMVTNSDIYSVENEARTSSDVDGTTSRVLRITAKASTIASTYTCTLSDATQGYVSCTQTLSCAASYSEMSDLSNSKSITVTITGLIGKPSTPSGISSSEITRNSVKITWSSASADFPITQYSISIKKKSDGSIARPTATTSALVTRFNTLTPYTDYIIEITAKTKYNVLSDKGTHEFKTDEGAAQSPLETKTSADSSTAITITWKQPSVLNGVLHNYLVRYKLTSSSTFLSTFNVGTNMTKTVNQLIPFTLYDFQVAATTKGGTITGTWSSVIMKKTLQGAATSPLNVTAVVNSSTAIKVSWQQPAILNGILHGYLVRYKLSSQVNFLSPLDVGKNILMKFGQLQAFTSYDFQVAATTKGGTIIGTWSTIITVKTLMGFASSPLQVRAVAETSTTIRLNWKQPAVLNGILHSYLVRYKPSSSGTFLPSIDSGKNLSRTFFQLDPFTYYDLQVAATTKGGSITGNWSLIIKQRTLEDLPLEPRNLTALTVKSFSIVFSWEKPMKENGFLRIYSMRLEGSKPYNVTFSHKKSLYVSGHTTSFTVNDLVPGTVYSVQVAAITGAGQGPFSSTLEARTLSSAPPRAHIKKHQLPNGNVEILLESVANINGPIKKYQITVADGFESTCRLEAFREAIVPSRIPMKWTLIPGKDSISGDVNFRLKTIGNFTLCFRAFVSNEMNMIGGDSSFTFIERKTLKTLDASVVNVTDTQFVIPFVVGPTGTTYYQIIVIEHAKTPSFKPKNPDTYKPSMLGPHKNAVGVPYITAEFETFNSTFTIGDGQMYSKSERKKRNTGTNTYTNSQLKPDTAYSVFQRAYIDSDTYYSSNWIGPMKTKVDGASETIKCQSKSEQQRKNIITGPIIGVIILTIIILILLTAVIFLLRRIRNIAEPKASAEREKNFQNMQYELPIRATQSENQNTPFEENEYQSIVLKNRAPVIEENYEYIDERQSSAAIFKRKKPPLDIQNVRHCPPMSVSDAATKSTNIQKDNQLEIKPEYKNLDEVARNQLAP